jgi:polar amino acid transport system substrate-binding protein
MKWVHWVYVVAGLMSLGLAGCAKRRSGLVIGVDATYPPFEYKDAQGEFAGLSVDLGRALAQDLKLPVEFKNIAFDGLTLALNTGRIDMIISSMTATEERAKTLDFSLPYANTSICLLVPKQSSIKTAEELKTGKRRIVAKIGTTGEQWARKHLPDAVVQAYDTDAACVLEVSQEKADAWVYDQLSVMGYAERNPDTTRAILTPLSVERWAIALRKGDVERKAKVDDFILRYRKQGGFEGLGQKHLSDHKLKMQASGVPFILDVK